MAWQDHSDAKALACLVESVERLAQRTSYHYAVAGVEREDLLAECRLAAVEAAAAFDRRRPDGFVSLCAVAMRDRARYHYLGAIGPVRRTRNTRGAHRAVQILDAQEEGVEGVVLAAPEPYSEPSIAALGPVLDAAGLTDRERAVLLARHLGGRSAQALADELGVSAQRVSQIEARAAAKVRAAAELRGLSLQDLL